MPGGNAKDGFAVHADRQCWTPGLGINLALANERATVKERCSVRYDSLSDAKSACMARKGCGGISRDTGIECMTGNLEYELRSHRSISAGNADVQSWLRVGRAADGTCTEDLTREPLRAYAAKLYKGARSTMQGRGSARAAGMRGRGGGGGGNGWSRPQNQTLSVHRWPSGGSIETTAHCVGPCCSRPLHRNRTCAFRQLVFMPPHSFHFVSISSLRH